MVISIYELLLFKSDLLINSICGGGFRYTVILRNCVIFFVVFCFSSVLIFLYTVAVAVIYNLLLFLLIGIDTLMHRKVSL